MSRRALYVVGPIDFDAFPLPALRLFSFFFSLAAARTLTDTLRHAPPRFARIFSRLAILPPFLSFRFYLSALSRYDLRYSGHSLV